MATRVHPRQHRRPQWSALTDDALLDMRFRDLGLGLHGALLASVERLHAELARAGLRFRPHCWLGEEWFAPDGVPGFAIPFYLAHPRLRRLERRMMGQVEGGDRLWLMRLMRHETGHALDNAYRLRRHADWRAHFGAGSVPYPRHYRARPGSRRFVQHLGAWYAQSHPTEDFAETFAIWLGSDRAWRRHYADWPAHRKLEYVERLMSRIGMLAAPVRTRVFIEPLTDNARTLREHYADMRSHYGESVYRPLDAVLRRLFPADSTERGEAAATFLVAARRSLLANIAAHTGCATYVARQVVEDAIQRTRQLDLRVARRRVPLKRVENDMSMLTRRMLQGSREFPL